MIEPIRVPIPEKMQKFYGKGLMLHPKMNMIVEVVENIPRGKVMTINELTKQLAQTYGADVTCPMRTGNLLKKLAKSDSAIPFWRVVKKDHTMIKFDHQGHWATILEQEGFVLEFTKANQLRIVISAHQLLRCTEVS